MSGRDPSADADRLAALDELPRDGREPIFKEPWEAQAFALAVQLSHQGYFTWKEWTAVLAAELKAAADRGESDDGSRYDHHWLTALERLVAEKRLASRHLCSPLARTPGSKRIATRRTANPSNSIRPICCPGTPWSRSR